MGWRGERRRSAFVWRWALSAAGVTVMVMRGAMMQVLLGLAIGIPVALLCVQLVASQLYEIKSINAGVGLDRRCHWWWQLYWQA